MSTGYLMRSTFLELRSINTRRAKRWHGPDSEPWTGADWSNAMCGEAGETANAVKKMRRIETGVNSNNRTQPLTLEQGRKLIAKEIGDTVIYIDLLAAHYAIDLGEAIEMAFNEVSIRERFPETILLLPDGEVFTERHAQKSTDERMQLQSAEFDACAKLAEEYRRITLTPVVDDDYPAIRESYEFALMEFIRALRDNGRIV